MQGTGDLNACGGDRLSWNNFSRSGQVAKLLIACLFFIGTFPVTNVAARSDVDSEHSAEKDLAEDIDYEELAAIFKKCHGKLNYTAEQVKSLKQAPLSQTKITDKELEKLSCLRQVLLWNLGRCHNLTRESLPTIKGMTSARAMDLADTTIFNDYDEIADTFKDFKDLEFLSVHVLDKEPTEKYKAFLKERPQLKAFVGSYKVYRLEHKDALKDAKNRWLEEGLITKTDIK